MTRILVLCTGNSCRSQMAEAFLNHFGNGQIEAFSAGVSPSSLNPRAVKVMAEAGLDISHQKSNHVDDYLKESFDLVITVCDHAKETCPVFPNSKIVQHKSFEDPADAIGTEEEILETFRIIRDQLNSYCLQLTNELNPVLE